MKIFISSDMEGTCGIVDWQETDKGKDLYERFAAQMSREVAAACEGANAAGTDDILVKDAHDSARNIDASVLPLNARIFRGWGRHPYSMMAGLDESFDGVVFTGYHSAAEMDTNPLSHTMNLGNNYVKINGELCPELMLNSLTAAYLGVPIYALTGDKGLCDWMKARCPGTTVIPVSEGVGRAAFPSIRRWRFRASARAWRRRFPRSGRNACSRCLSILRWKSASRSISRPRARSGIRAASRPARARCASRRTTIWTCCGLSTGFCED